MVGRNERLHRLGGLALALMAVGCSTGPDVAKSAVLKPTHSIDPEASIVIGKGESATSLALGRVGSAFVHDSLITIADLDAQSILQVRKDGSVRATAGGKGGGPGEFQALGWIQRIGPDEAFALDYRASRVVRVKLNPLSIIGAVSSAAEEAPMGYNGVAVTPDGTLYLRESRFPREGDKTDSIPVSIAALSADGFTELLSLAPDQTKTVTVEEATLVGNVPFGARTITAGGEGFFVYGRTDESALSIVGNNGVSQRITWPPSERPVTKADLQAHKSAYLEKGIPSWRPMRAAVLEGSVPAKLFPQWDTVMVGAGGQIWVAMAQSPLDSGKTWRVFGRDGSPSMVVSDSLGATLLWANESEVLLLRRDENDVQYLSVHRLVVADK